MSEALAHTSELNLPEATAISLDRALLAGPNCLLTREEAAKLLRVSRRTLERWAQDGSGPRLVKIGPRRVGYRIADVLAFLDAT